MKRVTVFVYEIVLETPARFLFLPDRNLNLFERRPALVGPVWRTCGARHPRWPMPVQNLTFDRILLPG
jgi:hypothetical protein